MRLRLFVVVWGEFLDLFESVTVPSLLQPKNFAALRAHDTTVSVYSDVASLPRAAAIARRLGPVEGRVIVTDGDPTSAQSRAIANEVALCAKTGATCLMVCPDNFWGDGSVSGLLGILGDADGLCVAVPHPRVDRDEFLRRAVGGEVLDNAALVSRALDCLHPSWVQADERLPETTSGLAGVSWKEIGTGLYAVTHLLPTVFAARFNSDDVGVFQRAVKADVSGIYDHAWPEMLVNSQRYRVIGSSDAAFIVELTGPDTHNVPLNPNNPKIPAQYHRDAPHIRANRNLAAIWRASA